MEQAKAILENGGYTCVLRQGDALLTSRLRGVAPLLGWLDAGTVAPGFAAADKVVGRATAYLYCLLGAKVFCLYRARPRCTLWNILPFEKNS